jgi:hypothetical protein
VVLACLYVLFHYLHLEVGETATARDGRQGLESDDLCLE